MKAHPNEWARDFAKVVFPIPGTSSIKSFYNLTVNVGGGRKNAISLKRLTKICQRITQNEIRIASKKTTSEYDIPYYVTNNSKVKKIYNWKPKKNFPQIIEDVYRWMFSSKKILKNYIK